MFAGAQSFLEDLRRFTGFEAASAFLGLIGTILAFWVVTGLTDRHEMRAKRVLGEVPS